MFLDFAWTCFDLVWITKPTVVTVTDDDAERLPESVTVTVHVPAATEVTVKLPLGPVTLDGDTVAMPLHVFVCEIVPE